MSSNHDFQTIRALVERNALLYPQKTAMKEFETGKVCTFSELKERAMKIGSALFALGAKKGDRVGILSQNSYEYMELTICVPAAGFVFVPVNFRLAGPEMVGVLSDAEPVILFIDDRYVKTARDIEGQVPFVREYVHIGPKEGRPQGWHGYEELIGRAAADGWKETVYEDDLAMLMYTSGTTGAPKGVMQTHLNVYHTGRTCSFNNRIETDLPHVPRDGLDLILRSLLPWGHERPLPEIRPRELL
jgi:long-chain acyl-CoA synthetase